MQSMTRLTNYRHRKDGFELGKYVQIVKDHKQKGLLLLAKLRLGTQPRCVEIVWYSGIPRHERLCQTCDSQLMEDKCPLLNCTKNRDIKMDFMKIAYHIALKMMLMLFTMNQTTTTSK